MPFIEVIGPEEAEDEDLVAFYERAGAKRGNVANVLQITSLNPALSEAHLDLYMSIMYGQGGLTRRERELIATAVSWANGCEYCITHHAEALAKYEDDEDVMAWIQNDPERAPLSDSDQALVDYALKLTLDPPTITGTDTDALRKHGFDDEDILAAGAIASYFNFVNRLNLGLGAELEGEEERAYDY